MYFQLFKHTEINSKRIREVKGVRLRELLAQIGKENGVNVYFYKYDTEANNLCGQLNLFLNLKQDDNNLKNDFINKMFLISLLQYN